MKLWLLVEWGCIFISSLAMIILIYPEESQPLWTLSCLILMAIFLFGAKRARSRRDMLIASAILQEIEKEE